MKTIQMPKYMILEVRRNDFQYCDKCSHPIKNVYVVKDTESNDILNLGSGCVKSHTGKSAKELYAEEKAFKVYQESLDLEQNARTRVQAFKELNPEMLAYLEANADNSFCKAMIEQIEKFGTLTPTQYAVVYSMMLPVAQLPEKIKDIKIKPIRFKKVEGYYGMQYTLYGEYEGSLVRVYFTSINENNNTAMMMHGVYDRDGAVYTNMLENASEITVSGSFDGYKIKRAKLS